MVAGRFGGALEAGGVERASRGRGDGFVAQVASGAVTWFVPLGGAGDDELTAVAVSLDGSVAVVGTASGGAKLADRSAWTAGQPGAVAARLDAGGRVVWAQPIGASQYAVATSVAWTPTGDLVVGGYFGGTLDAGGRALHSGGALDAWVALLRGGDGSIAWIHRGGGPSADAIHAVACGADGSIAVGGTFADWADLSSARLLTFDDESDAFVAAVGEAGFVWARTFPGPGGAVARALTPLDGGGFAGAIDFDGALGLEGGPVVAAGSSDALVVRLDADGEVAWTKAVGGPGAESLAALSTDGGKLVAAGARDRDGLLVTLDAARGKVAGTRPLGGEDGDESATGVATTGDGVFVAGSVAGRYDLGAARGEADGESDAFVVHLAN